MPKIIGDSLADHRDQVRQRLFGAIARLIVERGYDAVTLADIAAAAGVGRTAVYNHFPDKESVLLAWASDETERYLVTLRQALDGDRHPLAQLTVFLRTQMTTLARHHARLSGIGTALSAEGRIAIRQHVAPMLAILREILERAMAAGEIPHQDLGASVSMISAVSSTRFTLGLDGEALEAAISATIDFVLHGVGAPHVSAD